MGDIIVTEDDLRALLSEAFDEGWAGCLDTKECVVEQLIIAHKCRQKARELERQKALELELERQKVERQKAEEKKTKKRYSYSLKKYYSYDFDYD